MTTLQSYASSRQQDWLLGTAAVLGVWVVLACTAPHLPIVWDEGTYLIRADRVRVWFNLIIDVRNPLGGLQALSSTVIAAHWWFVTDGEGHPSWFVMPIVLGQALFGGRIDPLTAARLGPITLFSVACAAVAIRVRHDHGPVAGFAAPLLLLTLPRMFAEAHFATQDGQLTAWWLLVWVADTSRRRGFRTAVIVGVLVGLTCATKFTGWFALLPVLAWRALAKDRLARRELWVLVPVVLLTFYVVNPPLWHQPFSGFVEHVRLNLGRPDLNPLGLASGDLPAVWAKYSRPPVSMRAYFFGSMADSGLPYYPWYNTLAWLVVATPAATLLLGLAGLQHVIRRWPDVRSVSLLLHWSILMVVRALPGAPSYDGIRLFLPAFGFWCIVGGIGAQRLWDIQRGSENVRRRIAVHIALIVTLAASAVSVVRYYPQTLSHYSLLVGGVRGAARLGFDPTYWWDALDAEVLDWINAHTDPGEAVAFSGDIRDNVTRLQQWNRLRAIVTNPASPPFRWYVLQNRPGQLSPADRFLIDSETPAYAKYAGHHPQGVPADLNVPLILVFSYEQYQGAVLARGLK